MQHQRSFVNLSQAHLYKKLGLVQASKADLLSSRGTVRRNARTKDQYVAQRARGAYIASVCQPEASFDLSFAAQATDPSDDDIKALNKRLQWQLDNTTRGLNFVELDIDTI